MTSESKTCGEILCFWRGELVLAAAMGSVWGGYESFRNTQPLYSLFAPMLPDHFFFAAKTTSKSEGK
jgi:hypothetical protein